MGGSQHTALGFRVYAHAPTYVPWLMGRSQKTVSGFILSSVLRQLQLFMLQARCLTSSPAFPCLHCPLHCRSAGTTHRSASGFKQVLRVRQQVLMLLWQMLCPRSHLPRHKARNETEVPTANKWQSRTVVQINPSSPGSL